MTVAQVPLTDDGECEGGLLLYACSDGWLVHVKRRVGSIMAHDGDAVHGVTQLVKGIRCRLRVRPCDVRHPVLFLFCFCLVLTSCQVRPVRSAWAIICLSRVASAPTGRRCHSSIGAAGLQRAVKRMRQRCRRSRAATTRSFLKADESYGLLMLPRDGAMQAWMLRLQSGMCRALSSVLQCERQRWCEVNSSECRCAHLRGCAESPCADFTRQTPVQNADKNHGARTQKLYAYLVIMDESVTSCPKF